MAIRLIRAATLTAFAAFMISLYSFRTLDQGNVSAAQKAGTAAAPKAPLPCGIKPSDAKAVGARPAAHPPPWPQQLFPSTAASW